MRLRMILIGVVLAAGVPARAQDHGGHAGHGASKPAATAKRPAKARAARRAARRPARRAAAKYTCPMHPEVVSTRPGNCPKCEMKLRPVKDEATPAPSPVPPADDHAAAATESASATAAQRIPDTRVVDQDGRALKFYTDLVRGKTVAVNFIFTTCTTICPPLGATFARVQRELGGRAGRDVHLISVSVDPVTDTPERLKAWGAKFKAGDGWTFVTGEKQQVDELLRALAASSARPEDHSPMTLIGNDAAGQWTRTYGLARATQLVEIINAAAAGRLDTAAQQPKTVKE